MKTQQIKKGWKKVKLGEIIISNPSVGIKKGEVCDFIEMSEVKEGCYRYIENEGKFQKEYKGGSKFEKGDIIFARITPCLQNGKISQISKIKKGFGSTEFFVFRNKENITDTNYLYFLLIEPTIRKIAEGSMVGASGRQRANVNVINNYKMDLPPFETQKKIASILSKYDDLIENNSRRINILEQTAQEIYKEWFVNYRFPGYEDVKMIDSGTEFGEIPDGWEVVELGKSGKIIKGISYKSSEIIDENGIDFINLKCFTRGGGFRIDGLKKYSGKYKKEQEVLFGDIVMAVTDMTQNREIVARVALVPRLKNIDYFTMSCDVIKIEPENIDKDYLYYVLRFSEFSEIYKMRANGANVLHLRPDEIKDFLFLKPNKAILEQFVLNIKGITKEIDVLNMENGNLRETRDLLLPKLISGEVEVDNLDVNL